MTDATSDWHEGSPLAALVPLLTPARLLRWMVASASVMATIGFLARLVAVRTSGVGALIVEQWDPAVQRSVPTWVASMLFLAASLTSAIASRATEEPRLRRGWTSFAALFLALSFDQFAGYHDRVLDGSGQVGLSGVDWVWGAAAAAVIVGLASMPFLVRLPSDTRRWLLLAGAIYVAGALGFQELTSLADEVAGERSAAYAFATALETLFEMLGAGLYVWASYRYAFERARGTSPAREVSVAPK